MMQQTETFFDTWLKRGVYFTVIGFVAYGAFITFFPVFPFWLDEWLLIENIKFKPSSALWGKLDRLQQFPRVYLQIIKAISSAFDYSYSSLRVVPFLVHCLGIYGLWKLSQKLFDKASLHRWLWVLIYIAYSTSIHYFAQVKQYTMEMTLSIIAFWQLTLIMNIHPSGKKSRSYLLLCLSFLLCTFFSYTYAIVITPVYILWFIKSLKQKSIDRFWLPLLLGLISTIIFYLLDVRYVLLDNGMREFWEDLIMTEFSLAKLCKNGYRLFSNLGSGDLFASFFGISGLASFLFFSIRSFKCIHHIKDITAVVTVYSCLVVWITLLLFITGKLPIGAYRLNAFSVAAIGYMIVQLLQTLYVQAKVKPVAKAVLYFLLIGSMGNVYVTVYEVAMSDEHTKKLKIYDASQNAIRVARHDTIPVFITSQIAYPFEDRWQGDWILKTLPEYKINDTIPVYAIETTDDIGSQMEKQLIQKKKVLVLNGSEMSYYLKK